MLRKGKGPTVDARQAEVGRGRSGGQPITLDVAVGERAVSRVPLAAFAVTVTVTVAAPIGVDRCGRLVCQSVRSLGRRTRHRQQGLSAYGELARDLSLLIDEISCRRAGRLVALRHLVRIL